MDTTNSTIKGKAYEYACTLATVDLVSPYRKVAVEENESYTIAKHRYVDEITENERIDMLRSAKAGMQVIIDMEPRIIEDGNDELNLSLQPDTAATKLGDIRDVLIIRRSIEWEIGISVKHNHAALKHSRLSQKIDFGKDWMETPCSDTYFQEIKPIFDSLYTLKAQGVNWKDLPDKEGDVYVPLLKAFMREFHRLQSADNAAAKLVKYLIGSNGRDYYKLIHNANHTTTVMPFNINGTLNQSANSAKPNIQYPVVDLPTRIIELDFKEESKTTIILTMNKGWSISLRIHNASTKVEASLKFDIQLQSKPEDLYYVNVEW